MFQAPEVMLTIEQHAEFERLKRAPTSEQRDALRARVILRAAEDVANTQIAAELGVDRKTAGKWRARFATGGMRGLGDAPRSGRPSKADAVMRCQVIAAACEFARQVEDAKPETQKQELEKLIGKLSDKGALDAQERKDAMAAADTIHRAAAQLRRPRAEEAPARSGWTMATLAQAVAEANIAQLSTSTVWRILNQCDLKPHLHKMWLHSPDPDFKSKVTDICGLYLHPPPGASVICVDEKTSMQILQRIHPGRPAAPGQAAREEFEYQRHGTMCLFAGFEVHSGQVFGRLRDSRTAWDTGLYLEELAQWRPNQEIHIVWDNLNTHAASKWEDFSRAHGGRFHFHYTPIHASWVNQVECFFSIFARRVLKHASFSCVPDFLWKARTFLAQWNEHEAKPFRWTFTGYPLQTGIVVDRQRAA